MWHFDTCCFEQLFSLGVAFVNQMIPAFTHGSALITHNAGVAHSTTTIRQVSK